MGNRATTSRWPWQVATKYKPLTINVRKTEVDKIKAWKKIKDTKKMKTTVALSLALHTSVFQPLPSTDMDTERASAFSHLAAEALKFCRLRTDTARR